MEHQSFRSNIPQGFVVCSYDHVLKQECGLPAVQKQEQVAGETAQQLRTLADLKGVKIMKGNPQRQLT